MSRLWNSATTESRVARACDSARTASNSVASGHSPGYLASTAHSVKSAKSEWSALQDPTVRQQIPQNVQVVRIRKVSFLQHQSGFQRLLCSLLREPADVTGG